MESPNLVEFPPVDPNAPTQPVRRLDPLAQYQPIRVPRQAPPPPPLQLPPQQPAPYIPPPPAPSKPRKSFRVRRPGGCCGCLGTVVVLLVLVLGGYFLAPLSTRILLLGVDLNSDRAPEGSFVGRTDTIVLMQVNPLRPDVKMLSIPRDLWVPIPGVGENRINTAHFFAEANQPGSGPQAVMDVLQASFGVKVSYYARVRIDSLVQVIDALGGVDLTLSQPAGGLDAGTHHLDGAQARALGRGRAGRAVFSRRTRGEVVPRPGARQALNPLTWPRLPAAIGAFSGLVDTNLPAWQWPRLGLALVRAGSEGIDHRTITREMVIPFTTEGGAQVLGPNWDAILPMIREMFGN